MHPYIHVLSRTIPVYGICMVTGAIVANLIAVRRLKKLGMDMNDFIVAEGYGLLGMVIGAKLLYLLINLRSIDFSRLSDPIYFSQWMQGGFVFYGGLMGGLLALPLCKKIHHIPVEEYLFQVAFLLPLVHAFGRVGCFMAGCCYGRPYEGFGAVVFPQGSFAPAGIRLFPVQLVESALLFLLSIFLFWVGKMWGKRANTLFLYFILYGIIRFALEFLRYDLSERGGLFGFFSISQWISILLLIVGSVGCIVQNRKMAEKKETA